ncbi:TPA: hypothetical protein QCH65_004462 [Enterobacter roggenkampii]|nr:hypothetical protein [Enterobacter roggenkampii]
MLLRALIVTPILLVTACSANPFNHKPTSKPEVEYARGNSKIIPVNPIASSNNKCVDNFNFLRQAGDSGYKDFSHQYIKVGNGYKFLNTNKNIMDPNAKEIYAMELDVKLYTLCAKVSYAGFNFIRNKMNELKDI